MRRSALALRALSIVLWLLLLGAIPGALARAGRAPSSTPPVPVAPSDRDAALTVTTVDESGVVLPRVSLVVLSIVDGVAYEADRGETDARGVATLTRLPRGDAWVLANGSGRARASSHLSLAGARAITMGLVKEQTFDVVARDPEGKPLAGVAIEARGPEPLGLGAITDSSGRAHVGRLGAGPWSVTLTKGGYDTIKERAKDGDTLAVTMRMLGSILVHVVAASGKPAVDARVQIAGATLWPAREGRTGERGMVKLSGLYSGSFALRATLAQYASPTELALSLGPGENKELTLTLGPGRMVTVLVADSEGEDANGLAGARVVLTEGGLSPFPLEALSDRSGHASLGPIAPGLAYVSARADDYVPRSVAVPEPLTGELRLVLAKSGSIAGRVVDARGFPIAGASLEVVGTDPVGGPIADDPRKSRFRDAQFDAVLPGPSPLVPAGELGVVPGPVPPIPRAGERVLGFAPPAAPTNDAPWVTKVDGTFELAPVTPGRVRVVVHHPEFVEAQSDALTLAPGGKLEGVTIVLRKGGELEGRVLDADGRPAPGARLEIVASRGSFARTTRAATDGTFAFSSVPEACTIDVYRDEDALHPSTRVSTTVPEDGRRELSITLPAERESVSVHVSDDRGGPLAAAQITLLSLDPSSPLRETAFTDERGDATLANALGLPARLEIRAPAHAPKVVRADSLTASVQVSLAAGVTAVGVVRPARGNDPLTATVSLTSELGPVTADAGADGAFELRDLAAGPARLRVRAQGFAALDRALTLTATSSGRPIDLGKLELEREATVEGTVRDERGDPVPGARVAKDRAPSFLPAGRPVGFAVTDTRGHFTLGELAEGSAWLEAYAPDVGTGRVSVRLDSGRAARDVRITLVPAGKTSSEPAATGSVAVTLGEATLGAARVVVIVGVAPGSAAERAGLVPDDTLTSVDGVAVTSIEDARAKLSGPVEHDVVLALVRQGKPEKLRVGREAVHR